MLDGPEFTLFLIVWIAITALAGFAHGIRPFSLREGETMDRFIVWAARRIIFVPIASTVYIWIIMVLVATDILWRDWSRGLGVPLSEADGFSVDKAYGTLCATVIAALLYMLCRRYGQEYAVRSGRPPMLTR